MVRYGVCKNTLDLHEKTYGKERKILRFGFRSKTQHPLFMIWWEYRYGNNVPHYAEVIFCI